MKTDRLTAVLLAVLLLLTPALTPFARAEEQPETYIPEDFPNLFSKEAQKYKDYEIDSVLFSYAIILFNGRMIISPVSFINKHEVHDPFSDYGHMSTIKIEKDGFLFPAKRGFFDSKDIVDIINVIEIDELFEWLDLDINDSKFSKLKASPKGQKNLTVGEFIEIFKLMVPREMLPIKLESHEININPTIPKFKDEFLNKPIDYKYLAFSMIIDRKNSVPLFADFLTIKSNFEYYNSFSDTYEFVFSKEKENEKYLKSIGFDVKQTDYLFTVNDKIDLLNIIGKYYPSLCEPLADCETYGDLLEVYQMLPLEVQRQYKESDFQDNPYVDLAWLASRPTPPPYAELRVGSQGQEVLDMKQRFLELSYFRTTSFNDRFTDSTAETVRLFEKNNGLPVDGVADAGMLGVLFSDMAVGK